MTSGEYQTTRANAAAVREPVGHMATEFAVSSFGETDTNEPRMVIEPLVADYARRPVQEGFDLNKICDDIESFYPDVDMKQGVYFFVFRSKRRQDASEEAINLFMELDAGAHGAVSDHPDFLVYFGGEVDADGYAMSVCLWRTREGALEGIGHDDHARAAAAAPDMYEKNGGMQTDRLRLARVEGEVQLTPYRPQTV